jgi:hypothetical protein
MARNMIPLGDFVESFFEDDLPESGIMPHPWDQDQDAHEYKGFYTVLDDLTREHRPSLRVDRSFSEDYPRSLDADDPIRISFTAQEFVDAGVAMETEMQAHNSITSSPNYTPHPAYEKDLEMCDQLHDQLTFPLHFIENNLGGQGLLQWISLELVYRSTTCTQLLHWRLFSDDNTTLSVFEASDLVATFEQLEIASIPAEDMECSICYLRLNEASPEFDN